MRPVRLRFSGLRSYRSDADIDFSDLDLFAIIGDTGAGKSTIIEALCLALYAKKSWSGGASIADLIADGEDVMRIEFEFIADGHPWRVTRSRQRNAGSPTDKLESLDRSHPNVDQARPVTEKVTDLIGLNLEQFTRAVVMPQGRFDQLLQATETERNKILASILGHGDLDAVQTHARSIRDRVVPVAARLDGARSHLPASPAEARSTAEQAITEADERLAFLSERHRQLSEPSSVVDRLSSALPDLTGAVDQITTFDTDPAAALTALIEQLATLEARLAAADTAGKRATDRIADCDEQITATLAGFAGRDQVLAAQLQLEESARELPGDLALLAATEAAVAALEADPPKDTVDQTLIDAHAAAEMQHKAADTELQATRQAATSARQAWKHLVDARRIAAAAVVESAEADAAADIARKAADAAQQTADDCQTAVEAAAATVANVEHANLVAAVAAGHGPGDDCPVCAQTLPDGFHIEGAGDLHAARTALELAKREHRAAADTARNAHDAQVAAAARAKNAAEISVRAATEVEKAVTASQLAHVNVDADADEEALAAVVITEANAQAACDKASHNERAARTALDAAAATQQARIEHYEQQLVGARQAASDAAHRVGRHTDRCAALPSGWSPIAEAEAPTEVALADVAARLATTLADLDRLNSEQADARTALTVARQDAATATSDIAAAVVRPAERIIRTVVEHVRSVANAGIAANAAAAVIGADLVEVPVTDGLSDDVTAETLSAFTETVTAAVDNAAAATAATLSVLEAGIEAQREAAAAVASVLEGTRCANATELVTEMRVAGDELTRRRDALREVDRQASEAESIDRVLAVLVPLRENLDVLVASLANRQFVDHLLNIREAELLSEASRRLRDITGDRFAFAPEFGIVSVASGLIRSADALSGGERFQASLALGDC